MLRDRIEHRWIDAYQRTFELCKVARDEPVAILSETQSRAISVELAELALARLGARPFHLQALSPAQSAPVPVRSTGASVALAHHPGILAALEACPMVVDLTVEGLMHAPELSRILQSGARVLSISNEHPDALERLVPDAADKPAVRAALRRLKQATRMHVTSAVGTDLTVELKDAPMVGIWGYTDKPGTLAHWPGGLVVAFPGTGSVNGTLVLDVGDANLTFKRFVEQPVRLELDNDFVVEVKGEGTDAELMRRYWSAWNDCNAYAVSHVGWGMNERARYESLTFYDQRDFNGTEMRAYAGNFLFSTGANEFAGRFTQGHFDLPMRACTIALDDDVVVDCGRLMFGARL